MPTNGRFRGFTDGLPAQDVALRGTWARSEFSYQSRIFHSAFGPFWQRAHHDVPIAVIAAHLNVLAVLSP